MDFDNPNSQEDPRMADSEDVSAIRESILLTRKVGNYLFLPVWVVGILLFLLTYLLDDLPPPSADVNLMLLAITVTGFFLWRVSRRPRPPVLLFAGITIQGSRHGVGIHGTETAS